MATHETNEPMSVRQMRDMSKELAKSWLRGEAPDLRSAHDVRDFLEAIATKNKMPYVIEHLAEADYAEILNEHNVARARSDSGYGSEKAGSPDGGNQRFKDSVHLEKAQNQIGEVAVSFVYQLTLYVKVVTCDAGTNTRHTCLS